MSARTQISHPRLPPGSKKMYKDSVDGRPMQASHPSHSDLGVLSTCLYNVSNTHLEACADTPSTSLSPRTLYAQYFDNPASTGRRVSPGKHFKKDLHMLTGYDVSTSDKELDALPIAVRRKHISTLKRLVFAQTAGSPRPAESFTNSSLRYESCPTMSRQTSISSCGLESQLGQESPIIMSAPNMSIAERRGKSVNKIKTKRVTRTRIKLSPSQQSLAIVSSPNQSIAERRGKFISSIKTQQVARTETKSSFLQPTPVSVCLSSESSLLDTVNPRISEERFWPFTGLPSRLTYFESPSDSSLLVSPLESGHLLSPMGPDQPAFTYSPTPISSPQFHAGCGDKKYVSEIEPCNQRSRSATYNKFRWINQSSNPDLCSSLDDYHANLDGVVIPSPSRPLRPSYRRQVFANDLPSERVHKLPEILSNSYQPLRCIHRRTRSRVLSSTNTRRLPVASQKTLKRETVRQRVLDSAAVSRSIDKQNNFSPKIRHPSVPSKDFSCEVQMTMGAGNRKKYVTMRTIPPSDDNLSLSENDLSSRDPESPLTPDIEESFQVAGFQKSRPQTSAYYLPAPQKTNKNPPSLLQTGSTKPILIKMIDIQNSPSGTKETTLKMTLTRPDLISSEFKADAWQDNYILYQNNPLSECPNENFEIKGPLGGPDGWEPEEKADNVVKRLWNKVIQPRKLSMG